jgi:hypothetical protein
MQAINDQLGPLTITILPTIFYSQLSVAYNTKLFSTSLKGLCVSLLNDLPRFIVFIFNKDLVYWALCVISMED